MKRIFAFTLAEVLITLGIIGIVAAMTLPVLIQKYNKIVWYTQFRKAATQLEQALKLYQIDHGCEGDISGCGNRNHFGSLWLPMQVPNFVDDLAKYFNTTVLINDNNSNDVCNYDQNPVKGESLYNDLCINDIGMEGNYAFITNNGTLYNFALDDAAGNASAMDVNGPNKGPNEYGRDIFVFYLKYDPDYPVTQNGIVWGGDSRYDRLPCNPKDVTDRDGCATKLLQEGKMNY